MRAKVSGISRHRIGVDGEGVTTLVAFMFCPLACEYCLNPQTLKDSYPFKDILRLRCMRNFARMSCISSLPVGE